MHINLYLPTATKNENAFPGLPILFVLTVRNGCACASITAAYTAMALRNGFVYFPTMYSLLAIMSFLAVGAAARANLLPCAWSAHRRRNLTFGAVAVLPAACF